MTKRTVFWSANAQNCHIPRCPPPHSYHGAVPHKHPSAGVKLWRASLPAPSIAQLSPQQWSAEQSPWPVWPRDPDSPSSTKPGNNRKKESLSQLENRRVKVWCDGESNLGSKQKQDMKHLIGAAKLGTKSIHMRVKLLSYKMTTVIHQQISFHSLDAVLFLTDCLLNHLLIIFYVLSAGEITEILQ